MTLGPRWAGKAHNVVPRSLWPQRPQKRPDDSLAMAFIGAVVTLGAVLAIGAVMGQEVGR